MIEKTITTNSFDIISIGNHPITGFQMYRRFRNLGTINELQQFFVEYEEWSTCPDGKIYENYFEIKRYILVDINDIGSEYPAYTNWFNAVSQLILPSISNTLLEIPKESEYNYVIPKLNS